jgi:hypothetical protein
LLTEEAAWDRCKKASEILPEQWTGLAFCEISELTKNFVLRLRGKGVNTGDLPIRKYIQEVIGYINLTPTPSKQ